MAESDRKACGGGKQGCSDSGCGSKRRPVEDSLDEFLEREQMEERLGRIRHKVLVLSGKGGVGKSTVAVNLATSLALAGRRVGLLDVDFHGPSIPTMLHLVGVQVTTKDQSLVPVEHAGMKVMSIGFLLRQRDDAVIWRGPMKMGVIKQFLKDVEWGDLDYLVIDSPPGTGDEPLSVCQLVPDADGAVVVTTPQDVATADVRKSITFCRQLDMPILGVVENMSGFVCPKCGEVTEIFKTGGGEKMAADMGVPFLGRIPIDPAVGAACDVGTPFVYHYAGTETAKAFERIVAPILALSNEDAKNEKQQPCNETKEGMMRIAIPLADGKLGMHFGHCEQFALVDVDEKAKKITGQQLLTPPPHEPGVLPRWLREQGAQVIIAGGMGQRAQSLFAQNGIKVIVGAPAEAPEALVAAYMDGTLQTGDNVCDH
ncbi:MAG: chromosome partitioning protein ParA [Lentisphaerae bacterium RIFOXYB12_FULL_65_16]|nr:MAG: chromosome partitioning protein ParA [Lentisphaerae bacterium RIFOXYA12_64_32]OGV87446.1 MAG: chromosome partitioning protein ParA [Lentisphaerae bacterium RIFOXYB12_FULL_65_16]